jgi:hypothetical protein
MVTKNLSEEKRRNPRLPALMKGHIIAPNHIAAAPCVVSNISCQGTKLRLAKGWVIPRMFWLRLMGDPRLRFCAVVWRQGQHLGVSFMAEAGTFSWPNEQTNHKTVQYSRPRIRKYS